MGAGIPYPLGLPHPVAIRQLIGPPIELPEGDPEDTQLLDTLHARVTGAVQTLIDRAVSGQLPPSEWPNG